MVSSACPLLLPAEGGCIPRSRKVIRQAEKQNKLNRNIKTMFFKRKYTTRWRMWAGIAAGRSGEFTGEDVSSPEDTAGLAILFRPSMVFGDPVVVWGFDDKFSLVSSASAENCLDAQMPCGFLFTSLLSDIFRPLGRWKSGLNSHLRTWKETGKK